MASLNRQYCSMTFTLVEDCDGSLNTDTTMWERSIKTRRQDIRGDVSLEMRVIIESTEPRGQPVKLDDRLLKAIDSINQVIHCKVTMCGNCV